MTDELVGDASTERRERGTEESVVKSGIRPADAHVGPVVAEGMSAVKRIQAPGGWLEPLEEDESAEVDAGIESDRSSEKSTLRLRPSQRRRQAEIDDEWVECPVLGEGWKRREVFRRSGSSLGKTDTYYMSPKGERLRSKIELSKHLTVDLTRFDFKNGVFLNGNPVSNKQKRDKDGVLDDAVSSERSLSSERTLTPDPDPTPTPDGLPGTPQSNSQNRVVTPPRPRLTPFTQTAVPRAPEPSETFSSPPRLTRISPVSQSAAGQPSSRSSSLGLGDFSPQRFSPSFELSKEGGIMLSQSWLQSNIVPVSPPKTPEREPASQPHTMAFLRSSPTYPLPPVTQFTLDPNVVLNRNTQDQLLTSVIKECAHCGCSYPGTATGKETLCSKCKPNTKQTSPTNIVFRKVGQDQWVLGRGSVREGGGINDLTREKRLLEKKQPIMKSLKLMHRENEQPRHQKKLPPVRHDSDDEEYMPYFEHENDDDGEGGPKKRNRRACWKCDACLRTTDCGKCDFCMDKPKFGGLNKKRQKCRLRQCRSHAMRHLLPFQLGKSKLMHTVGWVGRSKHSSITTPSLLGRPKLGKRGRPPGKRKIKIKRRPLDDYFTEDEEEERDEDEEDDDEIESVGFEAPYIVCEDPDGLESGADGFAPQNGGLEMLRMNSEQSSVQQPQPQQLFYTVRDLPEMPSEGFGKDGTLRLTEDVEMVRVGAAMPELGPAPKSSPVMITEIHSLADGTETGSDTDPGLLELLASLRKTVLPAYWVAVMAKGPLLQLLQCSKLSTMADTVLQIESGFLYQIIVQNQPLLQTHPVFERHPSRLTSVGQVVALLLDLEDLSVCQGYHAFLPRPHCQPVLCVRAATCQLLVPPEEERCDKCQPTNEV